MLAPGGLKRRWKPGNEEVSDKLRERESWKLDGKEPSASFHRIMSLFVLNGVRFIQC